MCNLYSMTRSRDAIRQIAQAMNDSLGNLPELPGIYPDYLAPIVKLDQLGRREVVLARWGLVSLKDPPATERPNKGTTNVRNTTNAQGKALLRLAITSWGPIATGGFPAHLA